MTRNLDAETHRELDYQLNERFDFEMTEFERRRAEVRREAFRRGAMGGAGDAQAALRMPTRRPGS